MSHFCPQSNEEKVLLRQKGFFPSSIIITFEKYDEPELPPWHLWKIKLQGNEISVTKSEWMHAKNVYPKFGCSNIGEYSDLDLTCDTLILACVFEHFWKFCFQTYYVVCLQYYTASNLSGDAFLRVCKADIELLIVREHLDIAEAILRVGKSSVFSKRLAEADSANNLYGGIMEKCPLPQNSFVTTSNVTLQSVLDRKQILKLDALLRWT